MTVDFWPGEKYQHPELPRGGGGGQVNVEITADATLESVPIHHL